MSDKAEKLQDAVKLIKCLSNKSNLSPALSILKKIFPTLENEIAARYHNVVRTPEVDCDIVNSYLINSGILVNPFRRLLDTCLRTIVDQYYCDQLYINPILLSRFLIEMGADVNAQDYYGKTLLHFLIGSKWSDGHRSDCFEMIKYALEKGADPLIKREGGHDAIADACFKSREDIIYLIYNVSPPERAAVVIESLELYGAKQFSFLRNRCPSPDYSINTGIGAWLLAIRLKQPLENFISDKEFQQMFPSTDSVFLFSLKSHEKILGPEHKETFLLRWRSEKWYASLREFRKWQCISKDCFVQIFSFKLSSFERNERLVLLSCNFRQIFGCKAISDDIRRELTYTDIAEYLQVVVETVIIVRENQNLEQEPLSGEENGHLLSIISYLVILFSFLNCGAPERIHFKRLLRKAITLDLVSTQGTISLLEAVDTIVRNIEFVAERDKYISCAVKLLLECGVDANERDISGNTVLDCFASFWEYGILRNDWPIPTCKEKEVVQTLLEYGLHTDTKNRNGIQVSDVLLQRYGIEICGVMDLRCLAARVIRSHSIPYVGIIPNALHSFVKMH